MVKNPKIATISLDGGTLCLPYVNTVHNRRQTPLPDYLKNALDLIAWAEKVELLNVKTAARLEENPVDQPKKLPRFFQSSMKNCGSSIKALEWYYRQKQC